MLRDYDNLWPFTESAHCTSQQHCRVCRDLEGGRSWREAISRMFAVPDGKVDWPCPKLLAWGRGRDAVPVDVPIAGGCCGGQTTPEEYQRRLAQQLGQFSE